MAIIERGCRQNTPRPHLNVHDALSIAFYFMLGHYVIYISAENKFWTRKKYIRLSFSFCLVICFNYFFQLFLALISLCTLEKIPPELRWRQNLLAWSFKFGCVDVFYDLQGSNLLLCSCIPGPIHTFVVTLTCCVRLFLLDQLTMIEHLTWKVKASQGVTSGTRTLCGLPSRTLLGLPVYRLKENCRLTKEKRHKKYHMLVSTN